MGHTTRRRYKMKSKTLKEIETTVKKISNLLYLLHVTATDEYICEHGEALKEREEYNRQLELESNRLTRLLDEYSGVKKDKIFGLTIGTRHNKVYWRNNGYCKELRVKLRQTNTRQYHCVRKLFYDLKDYLLPFYYGKEFEFLSYPLEDEKE